MPEHQWRGTWRGRRPDSDPHSRARRVISPSGGIMRGKFPSRKNGRMVHHEGLLELDAIYLFEASPRVASYREQPRTILFPDGPRLRRYTPDFELTLSSGELVLVEVKPCRSLQDSEVRHKLDKVTAHLQRSEKSFVILTDETLRSEPRQANVRRLYHQTARRWPTDAACINALQPHRSRFPLPWLAVKQLLVERDIQPANLLFKGLLHCELNAPLTNDTLLHLTKENGDAWICIAEGHDF
jgi:hypothetical protein